MWLKIKFIYLKNKIGRQISIFLDKLKIIGLFKYVFNLLIIISKFILKNIITISIITVGIWLIFEAQKYQVFIDPISSPHVYSQKGYKPEVIANKLKDEIEFMQNAARIRNRGKIPVESDWTLHNIQVPIAEISIGTLIQGVRTFLKLPEVHIKGEITLPNMVSAKKKCDKYISSKVKQAGRSDLLFLTLRVEGRDVAPIYVCEWRLDLLIKDAAHELLRSLDPVIFSTYWMDNDLKKNDFTATFLLIGEILENDSLEDDKWAYNIQGYIQANYLNQPERAIYSYNNAINLDSEFINAYFNLAYLLAQYDRHREAIQNYRIVVKLNPQRAWAYNNIGVSLGKLGEHEKAIEYFYRAIEINPEILKFYLNLKLALRKLNRNKEADEVLSKYKH